MDSVRPSLEWRRARGGDIHTTSHVHQHTHQNVAELEKRVAHLEERLSAGASMADLQQVAQAALNLEDSLKFVAARVLHNEDAVAWLEHNTAHKDLFLKKDVVQ